MTFILHYIFTILIRCNTIALAYLHNCDMPVDMFLSNIKSFCLQRLGTTAFEPIRTMTQLFQQTGLFAQNVCCVVVVLLLPPMGLEWNSVTHHIED